MSSAENNTGVLPLKLKQGKLQMRESCLGEVTHQLTFTIVSMCMRSVFPEALSGRRERRVGSVLEGSWRCPPLGLHKSWEAGGGLCRFHNSVVTSLTVTVESALFFLWGMEKVLVRQDSKHIPLVLVIYLCPRPPFNWIWPHASGTRNSCLCVAEWMQMTS